MEQTSVRASYGTPYRAFLFAVVGEDADNGLTVSMLSALARQDLDPWEMAEALARMGEDAAVERCAELLKALPCVQPGHEQRVVLAQGLVALLPTAAAARSVARPAVEGEWMLERVFSRHAAATLDRVRRRPTVHYLFFYFMFVVFLVCSQWLSPSVEPAPADGAVPGLETPHPAPPGDAAPEIETERGR